MTVSVVFADDALAAVLAEMHRRRSCLKQESFAVRKLSCTKAELFARYVLLDVASGGLLRARRLCGSGILPRLGLDESLSQFEWNVRGSQELTMLVSIVRCAIPQVSFGVKSRH